MAATGTASSPLPKSTPIITRFPREDREALLAEEAEHAAEEERLRAEEEGDDYDESTADAEDVSGDIGRRSS